MPALFDSLPPIYRSLLPQTFETNVADESKATCSNCAMCSSNRQSLPGEDSTFFEPNVKCCTFHPSLPNFLVGAILADSSVNKETGRNRIQEKLASRIGVTPYGIAAPAKYTMLYGNTREFFGRSRAMRCPYYVDEGGGLCSIWAYREAVCSTYFCKHVAGADGRRFWMSLKSYLALIEQQLSRYAIFKLYPEYLLTGRHPADPPARKLDREELEDLPPSEKTYSRLWESWTGMEREFFIECHQLVSSLKEEEVRDILGIDGEISLTSMKKNLRDMQAPRLPEKLKINQDLTLKWLTTGEVVLGAYSELDALALPASAFPLLQEFRGDQTVSEVRQKLRSEKQTDFADEVLLSLYQHRVLEKV